MRSSARSAHFEKTLYVETLDAYSMASAQLVALHMGVYLVPAHLGNPQCCQAHQTSPIYQQSSDCLYSQDR
jgi:hypothetical protein